MILKVNFIHDPLIIFSLLIKLSLQQGFLIPFFNFNLDDEEEEEEETKEKEFDDGLKPVFEKRLSIDSLFFLLKSLIAFKYSFIKPWYIIPIYFILSL